MKRDRKHNTGFVPIGQVLQEIMKMKGLATNARLTRIWDVWTDAVGEAIAAHTAPAAFKGKLLIVHAASSTWIQQLHFLKKEMISNINRELGEDAVRDIKFKIGPVR